MEKDSLQGSVLFQRQHSSTQRRRYQFSTMRSEELRRLRQNADEMQGRTSGSFMTFRTRSNSSLS
jgi:hypothetical protein